MNTLLSIIIKYIFPENKANGQKGGTQKKQCKLWQKVSQKVTALKTVPHL